MYLSNDNKYKRRSIFKLIFLFSFHGLILPLQAVPNAYYVQDVGSNSKARMYINLIYSNGGGLVSLVSEGVTKPFHDSKYSNNVSYDNDNREMAINLYPYVESHNTWARFDGGGNYRSTDTITATITDFLSLDISEFDNARQPDGSLPKVNLGILVEGSDLIDAGTDVGLPYRGAAPDIGAFEHGTISVDISTPSDRSEFIIGDEILLKAIARDNIHSINEVKFYINKKEIKLDEGHSLGNSLWQYKWKSDTVGYHKVRAAAINSHGDSATSALLQLKIKNNISPRIELTSPLNGAEFSAPATISISSFANDADGQITLVEFFNGTTKLGEVESSPWKFDWMNVPAGNYSFTAVATDNRGATTISAPINVEVIENTHPSIQITSPSDNGEFFTPASFTITTNPTDTDGYITLVEFFNGTMKIGEKTASPWSFFWNNVPVGAHILTAVATDNHSAKTTSTAINLQVRENLLPSVEITSPVDGSDFLIPATITITSNAVDADGQITLVEFFNGTTKLGEAGSSPWSFIWNNVPVGDYILTAVATDNHDAISTSTPINVQVRENQSPSVSITSPANGKKFTAPANISISANANDTDGYITLVEFFNGTTKIGEKSSSPWSFSWNNVPVGDYILTSVATDNHQAKMSSTSINVQVRENLSPVIYITSPANGDEFIAPASITFNANAYDADGSITKVEFFNGVHKLGEKISSPWSFIWYDVPAGNYSLTAIATDNLETESTSDSISVIVRQDVNLYQDSDEFHMETKIYPNPNNGVFNIFLSDSSNSNSRIVSISSLDGKVVYNKVLLKEDFNMHFDISHFKPGCYILSVSSNEMVLSRKFIIR